LERITIGSDVILCPLAKNDGCCFVLVEMEACKVCDDLPFKNFLLAYFLKKAS
jgi:hypothetical protein